jgi:hypothetical protein
VAVEECPIVEDRHTDPVDISMRRLLPNKTPARTSTRMKRCTTSMITVKARPATRALSMTAVEATMTAGAQGVEIDVVPMHEVSDLVTALVHGTVVAPVMDITTSMMVVKARLATRVPTMRAVEATMTIVAEDVDVDVVPVHEASDPVTALALVMDINMAVDAEAGAHGLAVGPLEA